MDKDGIIVGVRYIEKVSQLVDDGNIRWLTFQILLQVEEICV